MAITRAQIPEQIDVFQEGGGATSITPEDILAIYGQLESQPVTPQDIQFSPLVIVTNGRTNILIRNDTSDLIKGELILQKLFWINSDLHFPV